MGRATKISKVGKPSAVCISLDADAREARSKALEAVAARHDGPVKPNRALVDLQALTLGYRVMAGEAVAS